MQLRLLLKWVLFSVTNIYINFFLVKVKVDQNRKIMFLSLFLTLCKKIIFMPVHSHASSKRCTQLVTLFHQELGRGPHPWSFMWMLVYNIGAEIRMP